MKTAKTSSHGHPWAKRNQGCVLKINISLCPRERHSVFVSVTRSLSHFTTLSWGLGWHDTRASPGYLGFMLQKHHSWELSTSTCLFPSTQGSIAWIQSSFYVVFATSRVMTFKKMVKKEEISETPVGTNWDDGTGTPLSSIYWKESNKALWFSRCRLLSYFVLWPCFIFDISYDLLETG